MNSRHRALQRSDPAFGRRAAALDITDGSRTANRLGDDLRLFALTFACGFMFMMAYLA